MIHLYFISEDLFHCLSIAEQVIWIQILIDMFITSVVLLSICLVQLKSYISPKYLEFPLLYTKKGLPRKQANRRRSPITPPPLGQVPQIIIDMLVGSLLGDAFGSIPTGGVNPVFEIKQSTIHSEYLFYMYFIFLH